MGRYSSATEERARNFSTMEAKCLNCAKFFTPGGSVYERRFCSEACRENYLSLEHTDF